MEDDVLEAGLGAGGVDVHSSDGLGLIAVACEFAGEGGG